MFAANMMNAIPVRNANEKFNITLMKELMKYFECRRINVLDNFKYGCSKSSFSFMVAGHGMTSSSFELLTMWNGAKIHPLDVLYLI
jgi:hypothetical protein